MAYPFPIVECPEYRKYICIYRLIKIIQGVYETGPGPWAIFTFIKMDYIINYKDPMIFPTYMFVFSVVYSRINHFPNFEKILKLRAS